jgi:hypothetical protein
MEDWKDGRAGRVILLLIHPPFHSFIPNQAEPEPTGFSPKQNDPEF